MQVWEANTYHKGTWGLSHYQGFNKPQNASLSLLKDKDSSPPFKAKGLRPITLVIGIFGATSRFEPHAFQRWKCQVPRACLITL